MGDARPSLDAPLAAFGVEATVALPGFGEFNMEPASVPITVVFLAVPSIDVPRQLDAAEYEHWDHQVAFKRADVPGLRHGAVLRASAAPGEAVKRWFVDVVQEVRGDEVRALVKAMPEAV
jgi:hypothetical protein